MGIICQDGTLRSELFAHLLAKYATGGGADVQVACQLIGELLGLGEQARVQKLEDEAALLMWSILCWLEEAEEHQICVDLHQVT